MSIKTIFLIVLTGGAIFWGIRFSTLGNSDFEASLCFGIAAILALVVIKRKN